jgi:hypothetical protein
MGKTTMTKTKTLLRHEAALKRVEVAVRHLKNARDEIVAAQADLSTVVGVPTYDLILSITQIDRCLRIIHADGIDVKREIDHDPTPQELHCGHGPSHGCGEQTRKTDAQLKKEIRDIAKKDALAEVPDVLRDDPDPGRST